MALTDKLTAIGNAIRTKTGGSALIPLSDMPAEILNIETGGVPTQNPALILMDWEGTKLAEYSRDDALALLELPAPNTLQSYEDVDHEYLSFQEWNWDVTDIKVWIQNHEGEALLVGAIYTTIDGQNHKIWSNSLTDDRLVSVFKKGNGALNNQQWLNFPLVKNISLMYKITYFGTQVFQNCNDLKSINIPSETLTIGQFAFNGCSKLESISLPKELTTISANAFSGCSSLVSITIPDSVTSIGDGAFTGTPIIEFKIPSAVTRINASIFQNCRALSSVNIPNGVTTIGQNAFNGCRSLKTVNIPDGVTSIGANAFSGCSSLQTVNLPDSLTSLPGYLVSACYSILKFDIPSGVSTIYQYAFESCWSLKDILLRGKPSLSSTTAFNGCPNTLKFYVPRANLSWFETATNWSAIYSKFAAIEDNIEFLEALGFNVDDYKGET